MKITEVRIFPTESKDGKLKAFATMTFDDWFVVRNVKVIQGNNGLFVAMPSRKAMVACQKCNFKNAIGSKYCNQCGVEIKQLPPQSSESEGDRQGGHMDIAHPITQDCRIYIQDEILKAYNSESGGNVKTAETTEKPQEKQPEETPNSEAEGQEEAEETKKPEEPLIVEDSKDIEL